MDLLTAWPCCYPRRTNCRPSLSWPPPVVIAGPKQVQPRTLFTIETAPGQTLSSSGGCGSHFLDITGFNTEIKAVKVPAPRLFPKLKWDNIRNNLEKYATYHTRFSETVTVLKSKKQGVTANAFPHVLWPQKSIVVTVPGRSNEMVIVGAHLDSVNGANRLEARAPGVDDNASGSFLLLESLRVLLSDKDFGLSKLQNTIEFHWYAVEEGGLRGSQDIFTQYANAGRDVRAMLNQDMPESFGLITDFTDPTLNEYIGRIIDEYIDIERVNSVCGYACSDHGSATRNGYPASFIFEAAFECRNLHIHTANDTIEHIDPKHVLQHGQLVLGFLYELGFSKSN
ncbi:Zn-dependent exopeptidase [Macroventuria anomochaeta]|uniref:Zn-dependent exopeptidase n=1 Tax=Macroventuria anomochaeta TaxID=301207 RepID=A0ACB6SIE7_9PLEO|nr:Zn-dependent exopeptidase [Macroventuria anomochaeta]KAF2633267.1 Zn-dependent exopeptidase [Macroventuria anomochaeta]